MRPDLPAMMHPPLVAFLYRAERDVGEQWGDYSPNAKGNFQFERVVTGWRNTPILDLRLKE